MSEDIERVTEPYDGWQRLGDDPDTCGVEAYEVEDGSGWEITVWAMEFVREDPLEREIREAIDAALRAVPGVEDVDEQDREVWTVDGSPDGRQLIEAAASVIDRFAERTRAHIENLG